MTFSILLLYVFPFFTGCKEELSEVTTNKSNAIRVSSASTYLNSPYVVGTDITTILQNQVNGAEEIVIPKGLYFISKPISKNGGSLNIQSDGAILQMLPAFPSGRKKLSAAFVLQNLSSVVIDGITIDGNRANLVNAGKNWTNFIMGIAIDKCSNVSLTNCNIINGPSISFSIKHSNNVTINNCSSTNAMYHGIALEYCTNVDINDSKVIGIGNQGIDNRKGGIGILGIGGSNLTFSNNHLEDISDTGTKTEGSNFVVWSGNTLKNCGKDGIKFQNLVTGENPEEQTPVQFVSNAKIINNTISHIFNYRNDGSSLIQVWNGHNVEIAGNIITGGSKTGQEDGICVWSNTPMKLKNITITGNTIKNTNRFIYLDRVSDAIIAENNCENLVAPKTAYDGVSVESSNDIRLSNNLFRRSATGSIDGFAIKMYETSDFAIENNTLQNANSALALRIASSDTVSVVGNQMDNFSSYAMLIYAGNPGTTLNSLLMMNNTISKVGTANGYSAVIRVDPTNFIIDTFDLSGTNVIGNATFGDVALEIKSSSKKVSILNLTGFQVSGNIFYPAPVDLTACQTIIY